MPNRIIKESICYSADIEGLEAIEEVFFYRLIVNCDDFGRCDARTQMLKAKLFPLKEHMISDDINSYLMKLADINLITLYENGGIRYAQVTKWEKHQQVRAKRSKYPAIDDQNSNLISNDIKCNQTMAYVPVIQSNPIRIQSESESESESNTEKESAIKILFEHYSQLDLIKHRNITKAMEAAVKMAMKDNGYSIEDCKRLLTRHAQVVKATEPNDMPVERRSLDAFFGQKVYQAKHLICSEYDDGGSKWERYKTAIEQSSHREDKVDLNLLAAKHRKLYIPTEGDDPF